VRAYCVVDLSTQLCANIHVENDGFEDSFDRNSAVRDR